MFTQSMFNFAWKIRSYIVSGTKDIYLSGLQIYIEDLGQEGNSLLTPKSEDLS